MRQEANNLEIDLLFLMRVIWKKRMLVIGATLLMSIISVAYSLLLATPTYSATTRVYVVQRPTEEVEQFINPDSRVETYLAKEYREVVLSQEILESVEKEFNKEEPIKEKVSAGVPVDTRIVSITVQDSDPEVAADIANAIREVATQRIVEVTNVASVTVIDNAIPAEKPESLSVLKVGVIVFSVTVCAMVALIVMLELLDSRIKRPEDIENTLGLPLLGVVPRMKEVK